LLELAGSRGLTVVWLLPPVHPDLQDLRNRLACEDRYENFLRTLQKDFSNLAVIDARRAGYDRSLFVDYTHLNRRGALALSAELSKRIVEETRAPGAGPRWTALNPYHSPTRKGPIEDLEESRLALRQEWEGRHR
jgi:hypothetical protein